MGIRRDANFLKYMPYGLTTKKNPQQLERYDKVPSRIILNSTESQKKEIFNCGKNEQNLGRDDYARSGFHCRNFPKLFTVLIAYS